MQQKMASNQSIKRMPYYLSYIENLQKRGIKYISTPKIALDLGFNEMSVKKDLSFITTFKGRPKIGHSVERLLTDLRNYLGYNKLKLACLVGVGNMGKALINYHGFNRYGIEIAAAFDNNIEVVGSMINHLFIDDIKDIVSKCRLLDIQIGIITVPSTEAQKVCDELVKAGIKGIWNFSNNTLKVPSEIIILNEDMGANLALLSSKL